MKTILVATDFSRAALNAAYYAADMALAISADIILLHVYQMPVAFSEIPVMVNDAEMKANAENDIYEVKKSLIRKKSERLNITTEVLMGAFYTELENYCAKLEPYAVVIGTQGASASERFLFGSNAVYAMKHLKWPIITVPVGVNFSTIKKIGLACDYNNVTDTIPLDEIEILVNDFKAELLVLNTGIDEVYDPEIVYESGLIQELFAPLKPTYHFMGNKNIDEGIMIFSEKNNIDLLIVLPKRYSFLEQLMHKSHTKQLVLHSHIPVMALHHHHETKIS